jgi:hypothetical protein
MVGKDSRVRYIQPYTRPPSDAKTAIAKIRRFDMRPLIPEGPASPARRREIAASPPVVGAVLLTAILAMEFEVQIVVQILTYSSSKQKRYLE